jgi:high-affinity K+ transport system ATPase subunit B
MGIRTVMITGDNPLTARAIAAEAGLDDFLAEATPQEKLALIPLALRGVRFRPLDGAAILRRNSLIYGAGGIVAPFVLIKVFDLLLAAMGLH